MFRTRTARRPDRRGAVLMVVLAMLTLFAIVGLSFVLLAESAATSARINASSLTGKGDPSPDPQREFNRALSAIIYGTSDADPYAVQSPLRGHSLADTMFARDARYPKGTDALGNVIYRTNPGGYPYLSPFSGQGTWNKVKADGTTPEDGDLMTMPYPPGGLFTFNRFQVLNHGYDPTLGYVVDPEWQWYRSGVPGSPINQLAEPTVPPYNWGSYVSVPASPQYRSQAAPYTYPDHKDIYLAIVDHSLPDSQTLGRVLQPSYYRSFDARNGDPNKYEGPFLPPDPIKTSLGLVTGLEPTNPFWYDYAHRMAIIRPRAADQLTPAELQAAIGQPFLPLNPTLLQIQQIQAAIARAATQPGGIFPDPVVNSDGTVTGDVVNSTTARGTLRADSIWIYPGGPVMKYKGKAYVAMIAPMIIDLSGRVNLSLAGNAKQAVADPQYPPTSFPPSGTLIPLGQSHASYGGYWPGEVNPIKVFDLVPDNSPSPPEADIRKGQRALLQLLGGGRLGVPFGTQTAAGRFGFDATAYPGNPAGVLVPAEPMTGQYAIGYNAGLAPPHYARANLTGAGNGSADRLNPAGVDPTNPNYKSPFPKFDTSTATSRFYDAAFQANHVGNHPAQLNPDYLPQGGTGGRVFGFADLRKLVAPNKASDKPSNQGNNYAYYLGQTDLGTLAPWQLSSGNFGSVTPSPTITNRTFNPNNPQGSDYGNPYSTTNDPAQLVRMLVTTFSTSTSRPEVALRTGPPAGGGPAPTARLGPVDVTRPLHDFRDYTTQTVTTIDPMTGLPVTTTVQAPLSQANMLPPVPFNVDPILGWNDDPALYPNHVKYHRYALARRDRQNLARDIFLRMVGIVSDQIEAQSTTTPKTPLVDGTSVWYDPPKYTAPTMALPYGAASGGYLAFGTGVNAPSQATLDTLRALAQLAVNMVDYLDADDIVTPFFWNPVNTAYPDQTLAFPLPGATTAIDPSFLADPSADMRNLTLIPPTVPPTTMGDHVVFGTELPRVVINEVYAGLFNHRSDLNPGNGNGAQNDFQMRFWLELHNALTTADNDPALSDKGAGRLQYPQQFKNPNNPAQTLYEPYAVHEIVISKHDSGPGAPTEAPDRFSQQLTTVPTNVTGDPGLAGLNVQVRVTNYDPVAVPMVWTPNATVDTNLVRPGRGADKEPFALTTKDGNQGYYVLAPKMEVKQRDNFPGYPPTDDVGATNRLEFPPDTPPGLAQPANAMGYSTGTRQQAQADRWPMEVTHTVLLRRLANPYLPPNDPNITTPLPPNINPPRVPAFNPLLPYINPFITVDFVERVPTRDQVFFDGNANGNKGKHKGRPYGNGPNNADKSPSVGRRHPYAAGGYGFDATPRTYDDAPSIDNPNTNTNTNQLMQRQLPPVSPDPANPYPPPREPFQTFFYANNPFSNQGAPPPLQAPRWLVHMDRQLVSPLELVHVSALPPALLTRHFGTTEGPPAPPFNGHYNTHTIESALLPGLPAGAASNGVPRFDRFVMSPLTAAPPPPPPATPTEFQRTRGFLNAALGLLTTRPAYYGAPVGGRDHGRININTVPRLEVLQSLFDQNDGNYFTADNVYDTSGSAWPDGFWERLTGSANKSRVFDAPLATWTSPWTLPTTPVLGLGGTTPVVDSTILRNGATVPPPPPPAPPPATMPPAAISTFYNRGTVPPAVGDPTHAQYVAEPLRKVWNSSTTTSNSFLMVATVGFFEVRSIGPNGRLYLGQELNKDVNGDLRAQFVTVVDRTGLGVELDRSSGTPVPTGLQASPAPQDQGKVWFTALAEDAMPGATSIKVMAGTNNPTGASYSSQTGTNAYVYVDGNRVSLMNRTVVIGFGDTDVPDVPGTVGAKGGDGEVVGLPQVPQNVTAPATITYQPASGSNGVMKIDLPLGAVIQKYHAAGSPVTNVTLGHPGPQPNFDVNNPRYRAVVPYTVQVTPTQAP